MGEEIMSSSSEGKKDIMDSEQAQPQESLVMNTRKVMVAIDDSDCSFYALNWVLDNLFITSLRPEVENMLILVYVQEPYYQFAYPAGPGGGPAFYGSSTMLNSVRKGQDEAAARIISRALQHCNEKMNIKTETMILHGDPKDMICEIAEELHVDLLVVGSRGLGMIKRAFIGSVSDYCAHHAKCPTLIVKPPKETTK